MRILLTILLICLFAPFSWGTTYNWYVDADATDDSGTGAIGDPWKTLSKLDSQIDTTTTSDTVYAYLDRGDTWTITHTGTPDHYINIESDEATVIIDAYGSGNRPIIDAQEDFADDPLGGAKSKVDSIINLIGDGNTVQNIEIKNHFGIGIRIDNSNNNLIKNCYIHHMGNSGVRNRDYHPQPMYGNIVEYCEISYCFRTEELGYTTDEWSGGINIASRANQEYGNTARYNYVHHIYGEGIYLDGEHATIPSVVEYNIVGDTRYAGVWACNAREQDAGAQITRYNLIYDTTDSTYGSGTGISCGDELAGGSNANRDIHIYGNVMIGLDIFGIWYNSNKQVLDGTVRIYNNMIIDCDNSFKMTFFKAINGNTFIYNNSSIKYDESGSHIFEQGTPDYTNFTINNNHFYGGTIPSTSPWNTGIESGDPLLSKTSGWSSLTSMPSFSDTFPPSNSPLFSNGLTLGAGYYDEFLSDGTDWTTDPNTSTWQIYAYTGNWPLGAYVFASASMPTFRGYGASGLKGGVFK